METKTEKVAKSYRATIVTKYLGATNHRGSRIKVQRGDGGNTKDTRITVSWDDSLDPADNHAQAIQQYLDHMGWDGLWVIGSTETGYTAVCVYRKTEHNNRSVHTLVSCYGYQRNTVLQCLISYRSVTTKEK